MDYRNSYNYVNESERMQYENEAIIAIIERKQDILINRNYEEYLLCLNIIGTDKLNWGSSIRFCWFDDDELKKKYKGYLKQLDYKGE